MLVRLPTPSDLMRIRALLLVVLSAGALPAQQTAPYNTQRYVKTQDVQTAARDPVIDPGWSQPERDQLSPAEQSALARREPRDAPIPFSRVDLTLHQKV